MCVGVTIVFVETLKKGSHPVVPQLDRAIVKSGENPGTLRMESNALDAIAFGLELEGSIHDRE